jgi:hypothetical protein
MYHAFQDYESLYYLMDLHGDPVLAAVDGDMWSQLRQGKYMVGCHRALAKVYLAELIDAIEYMHTHGIVHRDLKPENVLLTASGHVLVIDFGTAKDLIETDLNGPEFVGTPDFMSPEAVSGTAGPKAMEEANQKGETGADHTADLWALGAVAFQLHTGQTPFWSPSQYLAFLKIKRGNLCRPWGIADDSAWDLIRVLMEVDPKKRLGADCFEVKGKLTKTIVKKEGGYDIIRQHPYFTCKSDYGDLPLDSDYKKKTPVPTLRDLCIRACAELARKDALDLDLCDDHPPGDGPSHDLLRLDARDHQCVMHHLDQLRVLSEPTIYRRFFDSPVGYRLDKIRKDARDFVGLTRMTDNHGRPPDPNENNPYAEGPAPMEPVQLVQITNPLLVKEINEGCDEKTRKQYIKLFKRCIANINRSRPKVVIAAGFIDMQCRKLLARINDSIPVVVIDGSAFFSFYHSGVQCLAVQSSNLEENPDSDQVRWLHEELEQSRMAKLHLFVFVDSDSRTLPLRILKMIARGRAHLISGLCSQAEDLSFETTITYAANEKVDDESIRSTDSIEDEMDENVSVVVGSQTNGLRCITVVDQETWHMEFKPIELELL